MHIREVVWFQVHLAQWAKAAKAVQVAQEAQAVQAVQAVQVVQALHAISKATSRAPGEVALSRSCAGQCVCAEQKSVSKREIKS